MPISPARTIAFDVLLRVATKDAFADEVLRGELVDSVRREDAGLATELTLGVLRWQQLLDFFIERQLTNKNQKLDVEVRIALRLGVYQLWFLDRVPAHAAVDESVELVKRARKRSAAPLANAVLRKAAKEANELGRSHEAIAALLPGDIPLQERLGILHSHPAWLVERWIHASGEERTRALLGANNRAPTLSFYVLDPLRRDDALASLEEAGCVIGPGRLLRGGWTLDGGNPSASDAVRSGAIAIQDEASQAVAYLLEVWQGDSVLDLCAAPGGKTILLSRAAGPQGHVTASDLHKHRVRAMEQRFATASIQNVTCMTLDGMKPLPFERPFDRILVDVPCSGTGTLARHPEIRWRIRPDDLSDLHTRQVRLLRNSLALLAPGGRLLYSTCSLEPEENELVVHEVLEGLPDTFKVITDRKVVERFLRESTHAENVISSDGYFRTFPPEHGTDGFFAASIEHADEEK
jgi:16S rRNA (cytosine967-C5)-methyltransferase